MTASREGSESPPLPLLPTTVIGSYAYPIEKRQQDVDFQRKRYGEWALSEKGAGGQRC